MFAAKSRVIPIIFPMHYLELFSARSPIIFPAISTFPVQEKELRLRRQSAFSHLPSASFEDCEEK
jgi:hypothetical protein